MVVCNRRTGGRSGNGGPGAGVRLHPEADVTGREGNALALDQVPVRDRGGQATETLIDGQRGSIARDPVQEHVVVEVDAQRRAAKPVADLVAVLNHGDVLGDSPGSAGGWSRWASGDDDDGARIDLVRRVSVGVRSSGHEVRIPVPINITTPRDRTAESTVAFLIWRP